MNQKILCIGVSGLCFWLGSGGASLAAEPGKPTAEQRDDNTATAKSEGTDQGALVVQLQAADPVVRRAAIDVLRTAETIEEPNVVVPALLKLLDDEDAAIRKSARAALQSITWRPAPVLVDFYADWCGPCRVMEPIVHELKEEGRPIVTVDVDQHQELSRRFLVKSIPTFSLIHGDRLIARRIGGGSKEDLEAMLEIKSKFPAPTEGLDPAWQIYGPLLALSSEDAWVRFLARRELEQKRETFAPQLLELVQDAELDEELRLAAVTGLGAALKEEQGTPEMISVMQGLLAGETNSPAFRGSVALFLSRHSPSADQRLDRELVALLKTSDREPLRIAATEEIGRKQIAAGMPVLLENLKQGSEPLRLASVSALGAFGTGAESAVPELLSLYSESSDGNQKLREALEKICPDSKTASVALAQALADEDEDVRELALRLLRQAEYIEPAAAALVKALDNPDPEVKVQAAYLLHQIGGYNERILPVLLTQLDSEELMWDARSLLVSTWRDSFPELVKVICAKESSPRARLRAATLILEQSDALEKTGYEPLVAALNSQDSQTKQCAAIALAGSGHAPPVPVLIAGLEAEDGALRAACIRALLSLDQEPVLKQVSPRLIKMLEDPYDEVRENAAEGLKNAALSTAEWTHLIGLLENEDVRYNALMALRNRKDVPAEAVTPLADLLKKGPDNEEVIEVVASLLGKGGQPALTRLQELLTDSDLDLEIRVAVVQAIGSIAPRDAAAVPVLKKLLQEESDEIKVAAAVALAGLKQPDLSLIPQVLQGLNHDHWRKQQAARQAFAKLLITDPESLPLILKQLNEQEADQRRAVLFELCREDVQSPEIQQQLLQLAREPKGEDKEYDREMALQYLSRYESSGKDFAQLLAEDDRELVQRILNTLLTEGESIPAPVVPRLEKLVRSSDQETALLATCCLLKAGKVSDALMDQLATALKSENRDLRETALAGLRNVESLDAKYVPLLMTLLEDRQTRRLAIEKLGQQGTAATPALPALIELLDSRHYSTESARALGQLGATAAPAIPMLQAKLKNNRNIYGASLALSKIAADHQPVIDILIQNLEQPELRAKSYQCLAKYVKDAPERIETLLLEAVDNSASRDELTSVIRALGACESKVATERLINLLEEYPEDESICIATIYALSGQSPELTLPALKAALKSKQSRVRLAAIRALGSFGEAGEPMVPVLLELLDDPATSQAAAHSLGRIGTPAQEAIPRLIKMLDDDQARRIALEGLEQFGPLAQSAVPRLKELEKQTLGYDHYYIEKTIKAIESPEEIGEEK